MNNKFSYYVQEFFSNYMPIVRNFSKETIDTYKYTFLIFIDFLKDKKINVDNLLITDLSYELIEEFIKYLQSTRNNSPKTVNLRINSIKSFFSFVQTKNLDVFDICVKVQNIKTLKTPTKIPDYLTGDEIKELLGNIDLTKKNGLRDLAMISLVYDAGLRATEVCNLCVQDLNVNINHQPYICVRNGKGGKDRNVPISTNVTNYLIDYIKENNLTDDSYLFLNKYNKKYTRSGVRYILNKNHGIAKEKCPDKTLFNKNIHPHMLRHSKAVHLVESDNSIIYIRDFLGHSSIKTTEVYARISPEKQNEMIEHNAKSKPLFNKKTKKQKDQLEDWLKKNIKN